MTGDFSRTSQDWTKSYSGVLMQQGRVQVDADWNEQLALALHRTTVETRDVIGNCGTPKSGEGFVISPVPEGNDFFIHPGRYYVGGLLCEINPEWVDVLPPPNTGGGSGPVYDASLASSWLDGKPIAVNDWMEFEIESTSSSQFAKVTYIDDAGNLSLNVPLSAYVGTAVKMRRAITYLTQPFYPAPAMNPGVASADSSPAQEDGLSLEAGMNLVYIDAWQRTVNALEDPHIREVALNGPDTAERLQTVWQVRVLPVSSVTSFSPLCRTEVPEYETVIAATVTRGTMNARSVPEQPTADPCMLPPSAGFQGLQNQLYRIEIFTPGDINTATFVWSRDNAMVETAITGVDAHDPTLLNVSSLGVDDLHSFSVNDWVEIVDRNDELNATPRFLAQMVTNPADVPLQLKLSQDIPAVFHDGISAANPSSPGSAEPVTNRYRLRRWDMPASTPTPDGIPLPTDWTAIEAGVQVKFTGEYFAPRAWWLIPARTATADIEWPPFQVPNSEPIPQPPFGTGHFFCRIAAIDVIYGQWNFHDCREKFPPLTHICADDVCYKSGCTALKKATTVEEALDELCELSKLRFHKKMLHGWGVVCGLQVACGGDQAGSTVKVRSGYAIDCEGNDVLLKDTTFDAIAALQTASGVADGDYALILDAHVPGKLRIVPYSPNQGS